MMHPLLIQVGRGLARNGFTLRSGGARGSDSLWEYGARTGEARPGEGLPEPEIYRVEPPPPEWAFSLVQEFVDSKHTWGTFPVYKRGLLARNMQQILGRDGNSPSMWVLYWTEAEGFDTPAAGGTRYALRCAAKYGIPMLNLGRPGSDSAEKVLNWCRERARI